MACPTKASLHRHRIASGPLVYFCINGELCLLTPEPLYPLRRSSSYLPDERLFATVSSVVRAGREDVRRTTLGATVEVMVAEKGLLSIFSADQVSRLTGLSLKQLRYWDETGFFSPAYAGRPHTPFNRTYDFQDLVGLRAIAIMRKGHHVPLSELRRVGRWLADHRDHWSGRTFYVGGQKVFWDDEGGGHRIGTRPPGQAVMPIAMDQVDADMRASIARLRRREPDQVGQVVQRRYLVSNKPVIAGTRIPTDAVRKLHEAGYDRASIRREYPQLTDQDIDAALDREASRRAG